MNYFKKLFNFKRTRMIDEAVFFHKPVTLGKAILNFIVVMIISNIIVGLIQAILLVASILSNEEASSALLTDGNIDEFMNSIPNWLGAIELIISGLFIFCAIFYCKKYEMRKPFTMGLHKNGCVIEYLIGLLVGCGMISIPFLICLAFGAIKVSFLGFNPIIILFFVGFFVQGFAHNTFVHGYFTVSVARDFAPIVALSLGSVAFLVFTMASTTITIVSIINIFLVGFFLGIYMFKRGSIIGCSAVLTGWSFLQDSIFSPFSGSYALLSAQSKVSTIITGGTAGIGGGLVATGVLILATFILLLTKPNKKEVSEFESDFNRSRV